MYLAANAQQITGPSQAEIDFGQRKIRGPQPCVSYIRTTLIHPLIHQSVRHILASFRLNGYRQYAILGRMYARSIKDEFFRLSRALIAHISIILLSIAGH
jgi:hypothetical protein